MGIKGTESGLSLIELVTVLALLGFLAVSLGARSPFWFTRLDDVKQEILFSIQTARVLAIQNNVEEGSFKLKLTETDIDLKLDGESLSIANVNYPLPLSEKIQLNSEELTLSFNSLGETLNTSIIFFVLGKEESIQIESTGYAY